MGYDLSGSGGYFRWQIFDWPVLLRLAIDYGWEPRGAAFLTKRGRPTRSRCGYCSNDGQTVLRTDARALADALARALDDSASRPRARKLAKRIEDLAGRDYITTFVKFCRAGQFRIF